ncbi:MAG: DUF4351 domain-containing protein [Caldilineaceae bacterium]
MSALTPSTPSADYDSPWKEIIEDFFEDFMAFFFPEAHTQIDWSQPAEFLDKELQKITADAAIGRRTVDKLAKVWLKDGGEAWVLVHIEVQSGYEAEFAERIYTYNYRAYDRYQRRVATFVILADDTANWHPRRFGYRLLGTTAILRFKTAKLLDYAKRWAELEQSQNPFAIVVMAHLKVLETRRDAQLRLFWKWTLTRLLYERGYARKTIIDLYRFLDWLILLPIEWQRKFRDDLAHYEEERNMPYITTIERMGIEKGRAEGRVEGRAEGQYEHALQSALRFSRYRFGPLTEELEQQIRTLSLEQLDALSEALFDLTDQAQLQQWLEKQKA